ncbi:protein dehydratase [Pasteurellaceae bacterium 15-036681]|nr:protein dehydratase [Pasteurellaceae bacterium 15-036681]
MILYYIIILFGLLLIIFALYNLKRTKKLISPYASTNKQQFAYATLAHIREIIKEWLNFFTRNNPDNLGRNSMVALFIGIVLFISNRFFFKLGDFCFISGMLVAFISVVWVIGKHDNRKVFEESFPEVIQVVNSAISAGIGLMQALERCGANIQGPLGHEFRNIYRRLAIGEDVDSVFEDSYKRYKYKEYYYFIIIIKLNLSRGSQLKEVISRLSRVIADSKKMEKRKKVLTSEARMSAMIVACFPVAFMLFMRFSMPQDFEFLLNDPSGRMIFYYVIGSELLGLFTIWMLMRRAS